MTIGIKKEAIMNNVFISHVNEDQYFVNLLAELLRYHYINIWYCRFSIEAGDKFMVEIDEAIDKSNTLIAVVSKNTLKSNWTKKEISNFQGKKPGAKIIPIILEKINLDDLVPGLGAYQFIDFSKCMLTGFRQLLAVFDKEFLAFPDRRENLDRRTKKNVDRRESSLIQRMRSGFWKCYSSASGDGKFDVFFLDYRQRFKVIDALESEAKHYTFFDKKGNLCDIKKTVLEEATYQVWENMRDRTDIKAIIVIEAIAEEIFRLFEVHPIDKRIKLRRKLERKTNKTG
jgi:hypothetical protein